VQDAKFHGMSFCSPASVQSVRLRVEANFRPAQNQKDIYSI
jgi:hypothetical protein